MIPASCPRAALLVAVATVNLCADTLSGERFLLDTRTPNVAYALELEGLQLDFSFLGETEVFLGAETSPAIAGWQGDLGRIAEHAELIAALKAAPQACLGLWELAGRLKGSGHARLHAAAGALLKAASFTPPAAETKEETKEVKHPGVALPSGPLRIPPVPVLSPAQRQVFNAHLALATKAITGHVDTCLAGLKPVQRSRYPEGALAAASRDYQNVLYAWMGKAYPSKDISKPAGTDLDWIAREAARTFLASLKNQNGMALEMLGNRLELAWALEAKVKAAFTPGQEH